LLRGTRSIVLRESEYVPLSQFQTSELSSNEA
jgi:hypothetical protein